MCSLLNLRFVPPSNKDAQIPRGGIALACVAVAVLAGGLAACGSSGTELPPVTTTTSAQLETESIQLGEFEEGPGGMRIAGVDFNPGDPLPEEDLYLGALPELEWWNIPVETVELVLFALLPDSKFRPFLWGASGISPNSTGIFGVLDPGLSPLPRRVGFDGQPLDSPTSDWRGYPRPEDEPGERVMFLLCAIDNPLPPGWRIREVWELCVVDIPIGNAFVNARLPY